MAEIKIAPAKVEQKKVETPAKVEFKKVETPIGRPMGEILKELKPLTAQGRIKKAEQFAILSERFNLLVTKREQLEKFLIADDGTNGANLLFKNRNKTFEIANSAVIKEVLKNSILKK